MIRRRLHILIPLAVLVGFAAIRTGEPPVVEQARLLVFDTFMRLGPRAYDPSVPVRIVDLDDESLERLGQWPWPRNLVARLVDRLNELGAAVIAFDMVFAEPDRTSPGRMLAMWPSTPELDALRARADTLPDHDRILAEAIARANVVTGFVLTQGALTRAPAVKSSFAIAGDDPTPFVSHYPGAVVNLPEIEAAATGNGSFNNVADLDGVIRRVPLVFRLGDTLYPSLAAEALRVAQGARTYIVKSSGASGETGFGEHTGLNHIKIGRYVAPTDGQGAVWINYTGHKAERFISAWRVLQPDFDPGLVAQRIVLIGTSAAGLMDLRATPLNPVVPGVEVHAEIIEQILTESYLYRPDWAAGAEIIYLLSLGLGLIFLLPRLGALWCAVLGGATVAAAVGASWYAYAGLQWLLDPIYPSVATVFVYLTGTLIIYLRTETERRQVRRAFSRYLSPAVVEQLAAHPEKLTLGGEMKPMTMLFCDIRDFTTISEKFDAEKLTRFINRFLTPMTDIILEGKGTIDKYMGDCIMAFWNAPLDDPEHAKNACRSALAMRDKLGHLNETWRADAKSEGRYFAPVRVGIGLNTGVCAVGNLGSDQRFDYSVMGDDVNLASRLEGQSKTYGVDIVIGENTRAEAEDFATLELDLITVKGKTQPTRVYALLGDETLKNDPDFQALNGRHQAMIEAYRGQAWRRARELVDECRALSDSRLVTLHDLYRAFSDSRLVTLYDLYDLYEERIEDYAENPPGADWDGVYVASRK